MPFLRDEGPPVSQQAIQRAREALPLEYGFQVVNETGRDVLLVRVPKPKPDYMHDLAEVAFYVDLDTIRNARDVLLIGHEKTARLEPQMLRDHIRAQQREDVSVVHDLRRRLSAAYGHTVVQSPSNFSHTAIALRIPKQSVGEFAPEDVVAFRDALQTHRQKAEACQYAYIVAEQDFERLGRRVLRELLGLAAPNTAGPGVETGALAPPTVAAPTPAPAPAAAPPVAAAPPPVAAAPPPARPAPVPATRPAVAPAFTMPAGADGLGSIIASAVADPSPRPPADAQPIDAAADAPALQPEDDGAVEVHEEYEIVSRPKMPPPAPAPSPPPAAAPTEPITPAAAPLGPAADDPGYELMTPRAAPAASSTPDRIVERETESYEVFTSKPRAPPATAAPAAAAFDARPAPPPAKTKEYEIIGRASVTPTVAPPAPQPAAAPAPIGTRDDPRLIQPRASIPMPQADNGAPFLARTAPANPEGVLAQRFRDAGYELVEGLRAQGTLFAFAAHKPNGRRVLVKRNDAFGPDDAPTLAQLAVALGADICLVVADRVEPGTRIATWGTRLEVYDAREVESLSF